MEAQNNVIKMGYRERLKSHTPTCCCFLEMHKIFKIRVIAAVNVYRGALKFLCLEFGASCILNSVECKDLYISLK
jgi:hypothetical protein